MAKFVKLTAFDCSGVVFVNMDLIESMEIEDGKTCLYTCGDTIFDVLESPIQILALMKASK